MIQGYFVRDHMNQIWRTRLWFNDIILSSYSQQITFSWSVLIQLAVIRKLRYAYMFSFKRCKLSTRAVLDINGRHKVICGIKFCLCLYIWSVAIQAALIQYCIGGTWSVTRCLYLRKCFRNNMSETIKNHQLYFGGRKATKRCVYQQTYSNSFY